MTGRSSHWNSRLLRHSAATRRAFTLVELMVVLVIIIILAGLVFSVSGAARGAARRTMCINNLRQLGTALEMVREDHGEYPQDLSEIYKRSDRDVWYCPSDRRIEARERTILTSYEYPRGDAGGAIAERAKEKMLLLVCRHHDKRKALLTYEGGAIKFQSLPEFLR